MRIEDLYSIYIKHPIICTDTRKISPGCLFFALKGDNFDGNVFAEQALAAGAGFAVIDNPAYEKHENIILVDDVLSTLQQLAAYHRKQLKIPVIGITGTNGKTTTKELIKSVLSVKYKTYATPGNLNNHIGVPLTILAIDSSIEIAIIEMGANHQKEIAALCKIAQPELGLITNVGKGHLEGFGGFEGVKKGKGELYDFLKENGGLIFANESNSFLREMIAERKILNLTYYNSTDSGLKGELVENDPFLVIDWSYGVQKHRLKTNLTGPYNLENILAAIAIGKHFNLSDKQINQGITSYIPGNNRSQITKTTRNTLICDYYNANPSSMMVALDNFSTIDSDNKILILGDMFELGTDSLLEHKNIVEKAKSTHSHEQIFIGNDFFANKTAGSKFFKTTTEALEYLKTYPIQHATILIKGSRGMQLERLVDVL